VVAFAFVLAAALTWRKWPDVLIDFGTQLYIPWRILHGAVLYRDSFYIAGGPLSQYFNALLFQIFGVSFSTLIFTNLALSAAIIFVIYLRFSEAADAWTATLMGIGVVLVFAFAEFTPIGNYNYITPYSHEAFHGLVLSVFTIALLSDWIRKGAVWPALVAGFCTGLVFLTKPDIFIALAVATVAALVVFYLKWQRKNLGKSLLAFVAAAAVPLLFFFIYFLRVESAHDSLRSVLFGWLPLLQGEVTRSPFYIWCLGLDKPQEHLKQIFVYFFCMAGVVVAFAFVLWWTKMLNLKGARYAIWLMLVLPVVYGAAMFDWIQCGWPLPLLALSACLLIAWSYKKMEQPPVFPLLWSLFGLALLAKLGLFPRIWHYGFVLAMPAFVSSIYLLFWLLPHLLERKFAMPSLPFRVMVGLVLAVGYYNLFEGSESLYCQKTLALGTGGDTVYTYNLSSETSQGIATALVWSDKFMPTNATLAVLPQGIMLNYLMRRVNPAPEMDWNPTIFTVFGQERMTEAFEHNPPDYIFIVEWDSSVFGTGYFGSSPDYGQPLMQWIQKNYQPQVLIGNEPLKNGLFGVKILKRLPGTQAQSGGFNASRLSTSWLDKKFIPTSNDASVQPKPSGVM
jgi:4-amino-4-deoxy-L-arabinose transferase-like glycosyltransferase